MNKVVVITGPTAVGKTKLSVELAKKLKCDLINADAYQVYKKMNIGTAKPTNFEKSGVVHHMMDILEPTCEFSVSDYQKEVRSLIDKMTSENKLPVLVGGSGLYIDTVIKEYHFEEEKRFDDSMYDSYTNEELHNLLKSLDESLASTIHMNNRKRVIRAVELSKSPVKKISRSQRGDFHYDTLLIFLNDEREALYERINSRVDKMINDGLLDEIKKIGIDNFSKTSKVAIGYKEAIEYLENKISYEEMIDKIKQNSRHYAKRQLTWFKNKTDAVIVNVDINNFDKTINEVYNKICKFLK